MSFDHDKRICIYPDYINGKRTVKQGRKVPVPKGCEDPTLKEMMDSLEHLKMPADVENKAYPRNWLIRGRIRVQLKNEDGSLVNPEIPSRRILLKKIAELIPRHPGRQGKKPAAGKGESSAAAAVAAAAAAAAAGPSKQQQQQQGGKKGGKKKK